MGGGSTDYRGSRTEPFAPRAECDRAVTAGGVPSPVLNRIELTPVPPRWVSYLHRNTLEQCSQDPHVTEFQLALVIRDGIE